MVQYELHHQMNADEAAVTGDTDWDVELAHGSWSQFQRRIFDRVLEETELFGADGDGYEIAYQDKFYRVRDGQIAIVKANPFSRKAENRLLSFGDVQIAEWKGELVSAKVAVFGVVLEYDAALVVVGNGPNESVEIHTVPGEPVNWRVFPRSANYRNHLHVVRDDVLEVWSFNHDFFVEEQKYKKMGTRYSAVSGRSSS